MGGGSLHFMQPKRGGSPNIKAGLWGGPYLFLVNIAVPCIVSIFNLNNDQPEQPNKPACMSTVALKVHISQTKEHAFLCKTREAGGPLK